MSKNALPVGVFDSGLGGLTAVRQIEALLPHEDVLYFGDTGRLPYGTRSPAIIRRYACDDMNFLLTHKVKAVVVACGTVSSTALDVLKERFDVPIIGVVEPAAALAVSLSKKKRVGILATPSTVRSGAFERAIAAADETVGVQSVGCPLFVPLVENGYIGAGDPVTTVIAREYVGKLADFAPDVIILGCTHYPIIRPLIEEAARELIGESVVTVDSGAAAAMALKTYLEETGTKADKKTPGKTDFYVSDDPEGFERVATLFLGRRVESAKRIDIGDYLWHGSEP